MNSLSDNEIKVKALELAIERAKGNSYTETKEVVKEAKEYEEFLSGKGTGDGGAKKFN